MIHSHSDEAPDAVIIGAGHNGLVAANILQDAGWDVVVCEATPFIGGAIRSAEVTAPQFVSDLFSAFYPLAAASPVLAALDLEAHGLQWRHAPAVLAHVFPDDRCAVLSRDVESTAASVGQFSATDADRWHELVQQWEPIEAHVIDALFTPFPPMAGAGKLARTLGVAGTARLARMAVMPVRRFTQEWFTGDGARMLIAGNAGHADLSPDSAGSAVYGWLLAMVGQTHGFPVPAGGSGSLAEALTRRLRERGGTVRTSAPVEQVVIGNNTALGVRLHGGELIRARGAVLADVAAPILYRDLVGLSRLPARMGTDLDHFEWDTPTLKLDWALSGKVPWSNPHAWGAGTVHLGVDLNGLTDYAGDLACQRVPRQPFILFGQMTTADPDRSPAGTESAWAYTHLPIGLHMTASEIDRHVDTVEATIERHAPGFRNLIVGRLVQAPSDLQDSNPNLVHGAINGGTAQLHQQLIFRPLPGLGGAATPVDRLFLAGSSAHPGGGVHGAPGANAARAALVRTGITGAMVRRVTSLAYDRLY